MSMCEHVNNFTSIKTNRRSVFGRYHSRVVLPDVNTQTNDVRFDNNLQLDSSNRSIAVPVRLSFDFEDFCCNDILVKWIKVCDSST